MAFSELGASRGPYGAQVGADGNTYFRVLSPAAGVLRAYENLLAARDIFLRGAAVLKDPVLKEDARAQAAACDLVVKEVSDGAIQVAALTAVESEKQIANMIRQRQLRPDPPGKPFQQRLRDSITSRPISRGAVGTLEVGVADISELDKVVGNDGQPYWRAQEFGSTHLVGRTIRGFFMPGQAAPDQSQFRQHPVFETDPSGAPMFIKRPIPAKGFLRVGSLAAEVFRSREFAPIEAAAVAEVRSITAGTSAVLPSLRRLVR